MSALRGLARGPDAALFWPAAALGAAVWALGFAAAWASMRSQDDDNGLDPYREEHE
ncbi:MAG: hypothetical protein ACRDYU_03760 [Actinomycetes bacterium]